MSRFCPMFLMVFASFMAMGQERAAFLFGQYNGLSATHINPSFGFNSAHAWDLQLAGAQAFIQSNYAAVTHANPLRLARSYENVFVPINRNDVVPESQDMVMTFNESGSTYGDFKAELLGIGCMISVSDNLKIGLSSKARVLATAYDIFENANYYTATNLLDGNVYEAHPIHAVAMAFAEIDIHGAYKIDKKIAVGFTAKYLKGIESVYAANDLTFSYSEFSDGNIDIVSSGAFTLAHSMPESDDESGLLAAKGTGVGLDLGIAIEEPMGEGSQLGISILDLGYIQYSGVAQSYGFGEELILQRAPYDNIETLEALSAQLQEDFNVLDSSTDYKLLLPTALSIQYIQSISDQVSIAGHWTQRVPLANKQAARSNSLNVTAMYERKHFSAFLPVTLYNYSRPHIGLGVRLGIVTIGSDDIMSWLGRHAFNGTDIYAKVSIYPFQLPSLDGGRSNKQKNVQCYF